MIVRFIHGPLIALLQVYFLGVVPHASSLVASLLILFAPNDVQYQGITRHLLVVFDFDYIANLDVGPVTPLETFVPLRKDEFLNWLVVDVVSCLTKFLVVPQVKYT